MQNTFFQIISMLKYKLLARHRRGFSVHSPFVFELLNNVFFEKEHYYCYEEIEKIVAKNTHKLLFFNKLKYYKLFFRLANYFNAQKILIVGKNSFIEKIFTFVSSKTQIFYTENIEKIEKNDFDLIFFACHCGLDCCWCGFATRALNTAHRLQIGASEAECHCGLDPQSPVLCCHCGLDPQSPVLCCHCGLDPQAPVLCCHCGLDPQSPVLCCHCGLDPQSLKNSKILIFENIYKNKKINDVWKNICNDNNLKISIDIFRYGIIINKNDIPKQHYRVAF